jgi:hypothetical protein
MGLACAHHGHSRPHRAAGKSTLLSLSAQYQRHIDLANYEVIVVDNGLWKEVPDSPQH